MSKSIKKAPSTTGADDVSGSSRFKHTKENTTMNPIIKAFYGVIYLTLRVCFIIAGVALVKMPRVHFIVDIPLYQVVGVIIMLFLVYLELYAYLTKPVDGKTKKARSRTAIESLGEGFIETPIK